MHTLKHKKRFKPLFFQTLETRSQWQAKQARQSTQQATGKQTQHPGKASQKRQAKLSPDAKHQKA
jgi:hypothetical protein